MADTHVEGNEGLYHHRKVMDSVREIGAKFNQLKLIFGSMSRMKDGDGSQASHFQKVVDLFGIQGVDANAKLAKAKTYYDELNSALNNSAALLQLLDILG